MTGLALPLAAALTLHADALQMGLLTSFGLAPHLFLYLAAGAWVDRRRRRPFMVSADLARAALIGSVPLLALLGWLRIELLYAIAFATAALTIFFDLAYAARVQSLVPPRLRPAANSRVSLSRSASFVAGPGLAGVLVQALGAPYALLADAASFLASAGLIGAMRAPEPAPGRSRTGLWREITEGVRFTFGHPVLRPFYIWISAMNFFAYIFSAVYILYLVRPLHLPPALVGLPFGFAGLGAILGSLLAGPASRRFGIGLVMIAGVIAYTGARLAVPLLAGPALLVTAVLAVSNLVLGVGLMLLDTNASTMFQNLVPGDLMGRANAATRQVNWGVRPLGALAGGLLGQSLGLHTTIWIGALGGLAASLALLATPVRGYREEA